MNRVSTGRLYEDRAALFLEGKGMRILVRNFRCRQGEVDLIGLHQGCLVFVEVKYRRNEEKGMPEEAVGVWKQQKICRTSDYFRIRHPEYGGCQVRFDVAAITGERIRWHQNAFPYQGGASW